MTLTAVLRKLRQNFIKAPIALAILLHPPGKTLIRTLSTNQVLGVDVQKQ